MGSSEFFLFWLLNRYLPGKQLAADAASKQAVASSVQEFHEGFFHAGMQALAPQWNEYLNVNGDYLEVWCVPSTLLVPCTRTCPIQNTILRCTVFVTLFFESPLYTFTTCSFYGQFQSYLHVYTIYHLLFLSRIILSVLFTFRIM
jgi:hypothetical protein